MKDETRFPSDPYELARAIHSAPKRTPVKAYVQGGLEGCSFPEGELFGEGRFWILFGDWEDVTRFLAREQDRVRNVRIECDRRNSALPLAELTRLNARVEPGAILREGVTLAERSVVMMGAVLNVGSQVGEGSMIDMNAVLGARAVVGRNCHIGAGAVLAGVLEPPSSQPVVVGDHVMVGAGAVVLEGVHIADRAVVAAGAVVIHDVPRDCVVAGVPARIIKKSDEQTRRKTGLLPDLR